MKVTLTILFIVFIGLFAQAQENSKEIKVTAPTEQVMLSTPTIQILLNSNEIKVVRLYIDKNYKVKKELSFATKANTSKLA